MDEPIVLAVQRWLSHKPHTLWSRAFDLSQNPDAAARWFAEQMDDFMAWASSGRASQ